jgi:hypothetical protein
MRLSLTHQLAAYQALINDIFDPHGVAGRLQFGEPRDLRCRIAEARFNTPTNLGLA